MKALIIDNGSSYTDRIPSILRGDSFDILTYDQLQGSDLSYDYFILSGGHKFPIINHEEALSDEIKLILSKDQPILGICFGFELIAHTFGANLKRGNTKQKGIKPIKIIHPDPIFSGLTNLEVYESHHWVVKDVSPNLVPLAESKSGIEVFKHKDKLIYGFQFHPEMLQDQTVGDELFANWHKIVENNSKYAKSLNC